MPVRVVTDSTCDLPREIVRDLEITVVQLTVAFGDEAFRDGVDIDGPAFYERLIQAKELPRTSQPSTETFRDAYLQVADDANEVVSIHVSSRLSGTINAASIAREELSHQLHIDIIDSYNVSLGLGAVVVEAAHAARAGASMEEVGRVARGAMNRVKWYAFLDTLEYLQRGGRIGRARALAGSLLSIKPILHAEDGEIAPFERIRTRGRAVERLYDLAMEDAMVKRLYVASADNDDEAEAFVERLRPRMPHTDFVVAQFGPVIGVYTGPNALGFCMVHREP
ncbi:MAG: DegV family protein [Dehalococcoidia bacterium]